MRGSWRAGGKRLKKKRANNRNNRNGRERQGRRSWLILRRVEQEPAAPPPRLSSPQGLCLKIQKPSETGGSAEPFVPNSVLFSFPSWSLPFIWIVPQKPGFVASVYSHGSVTDGTTQAKAWVGVGGLCMCVLLVCLLLFPHLPQDSLLICFFLLWNNFKSTEKFQE